jgi:SRSO17 transposase
MWAEIEWREGTKGTMSSRFAVMRVRPAHQDEKRTEVRAIGLDHFEGRSWRGFLPYQKVHDGEEIPLRVERHQPYSFVSNRTRLQEAILVRLKRCPCCEYCA